MLTQLYLLLMVHVCWSQREGCDNKAVLTCRTQMVAGSVLLPYDCAEGEEPFYSNQTDPPCCPSCLPPQVPFCAASELPRFCNSGERPHMNATGCLSCRYFCSATRKSLCRPASPPPPCFLNEPWYDENCCPSCSPISACHTNASLALDCGLALNVSLPDCPDGVDGRLSFDPVACCPVCRKVWRITAPAVCTLEEFISCNNISRECASGEEPLPENEQCCRHCRRIERRSFCLLEDVGECLASRPFCAVGQYPVVLEGECCQSCRVPLSPLCINGLSAPSCASPQRCLRGPDGANGCRGFGPISFMVSANGLVPQQYVAHMSRLPLLRSEAAVELIVEMVQRFCDRPEFIVVCTAFKMAAVEGLHATDPASALSVSSPYFVVRAQYPILPDWQCNATADSLCVYNWPPVSFLNFLNRVFADPEATYGLQVTVAYGAASSLHPTLALLCVLVLSLLTIR